MTLSEGFYAAGYLVGLGAFLGMAQRRRMLTDGVLGLMAVGLLGGMVFANLTQRLLGGTAGKTVLGAIAGGYLCVMVCKRLWGIRRPLGDLFAVAISAGEAVGRWGCFFGGCCYGRVCHLPWAVWQEQAWRHPTQVYLSLANLAILGILLWQERRNPQENTLFFLQGLLYCAARFTIEFWRDNTPAALGLSLAQWACLLGGAFFAARLYSLTQSVRRTYEALS